MSRKSATEIRRFRRFTELTQHEFGKKIGVTQTAVSHYECARRWVGSMDRSPCTAAAKRIMRYAKKQKYERVDKLMESLLI